MYYKLGNIIFEALIGPNSLSQSRAANFAQHDTIEVKPRLQALGLNLETVSMGIKFNSRFCVPSDQIALINSALEEQKPLLFIDGAGNLIGEYVLTKLDITTTKTSIFGEIWDCDCSIELLEYYDPNRKQDNPTGFAKSSQRAPGEPDPNYKSETIAVNEQVTALGSEVGGCDNELIAAEAHSTQTDIRLGNIEIRANKMEQISAKLETAASSGNIAATNANLIAYMGDVNTSISNLKAIAALGSITDTRAALGNLQLVFDNVKTLSAGNLVLYATRRF